jgi:MacB-like periplasmic core domain
MPMFAYVNNLFRNCFRKARIEQDLDDEIRSHLQLLTDQNVREGMNPQEADRAARIELGGVDQIKEQVRSVRAGAWLETLWQDIYFSVRMLRNNRGFTAVAVLTLALGIGANTAIFSFIDALMVRLLPVRDPGHLVQLLSKYPDGPGADAFSWQSYEHFRDANHVFSDLIATGESPFAGQHSFYVRGDGLEPEQVDGQYVTGNFFPVLGIKAAVGRLIGPFDSQMDSSAEVAVVSWSYWSSRNFDRAIVGKQIIVQDVPVTIIGVTPRQFFGVNVGDNQDIWLPIAIEPQKAPATQFQNFQNLRWR